MDDPDKDQSEIQRASDQSDIDLLKAIEPAWALSRLEPFIQNVQLDVEQPTWNKVHWDALNYGFGQGAGGDQDTFRAIVVADGFARYSDVNGDLGDIILV